MPHYKHMIASGILSRKMKMTKRGMQYISRGSGAALKKLSDVQFNNRFNRSLAVGSGTYAKQPGKSRNIKPLTFKF
jgi:hypothetical protein